MDWLDIFCRRNAEKLPTISRGWNGQIIIGDESLLFKIAPNYGKSLSFGSKYLPGLWELTKQLTYSGGKCLCQTLHTVRVKLCTFRHGNQSVGEMCVISAETNVAGLASVAADILRRLNLSIGEMHEEKA